jgi:phage-related protein
LSAGQNELMPKKFKRQWRDYETEAGRRPVKDFLDALTDDDAASVLAAMKEVRESGLSAARHLEGPIYEVRAAGDRVIYRILFASQGRYSQVLLALEGIKKKTQKTPRQTIDLAKRRLKSWEDRGEKKEKSAAKARSAGKGRSAARPRSRRRQRKK